MAWVETASRSFVARHEEVDLKGVKAVLDTLEESRERLAGLFETIPEDIGVVVHSSSLWLSLAHPVLPVLRIFTAPAARRYLAGWATSEELHVLTPRELVRRASKVPGSREMLLLTPAALYARIVIGANNPALPPPYRPRTIRNALRWAWLDEGAAQWLAGQTPHARPAIARRLREGGRPQFPPSLRDATLLGGTVIDLLAREEGAQAVGRLVSKLHPDGARAALTEAFGGRSLSHTEAAWRTHLSRLAASP